MNRFGRVDVLVNTVDVAWRQRRSMTSPTIGILFEANLRDPRRLPRGRSPHGKQRFGRIINVASRERWGSGGYAAYGTCPRSFATESLADELKISILPQTASCRARSTRRRTAPPCPRLSFNWVGNPPLWRMSSFSTSDAAHAVTGAVFAGLRQGLALQRNAKGD